MEREKGVALITSLMALLLISAIIVGMCWMVLTDQRLGGNNQSRELAFYGAEAGMEKITTDVANKFSTEGALTAADISTIISNPPTTLPGIEYVDSTGASTYQITPLVPVSNNATILPPSPYAGMQGLITPFTLNVAAQSTATGAQVKLTRQIQVVAIPVFQFGIYSDSDISFFNGPSFQFGGRTHTNGNLWLGPNTGPLFLGDKVTMVGQLIRTNLENGYAGSSGSTYGGYVSIALTPDPALSNEPGSQPYTNSSWRQLAFTEGSVNCCSVYGAVSTSLNNPTWTGTVIPAYKGQVENGVPTLSLTSTALGGITTPISLIRRPVVGELGSNPAEFNEQFFSQATLRILLDDYVTPGVPSSGCVSSPMMALDGIDTSQNPVDLGTLTNVASIAPWTGNSAAGPPWWAGDGGSSPFLPLPVSGGPASPGTYAVYNVSTSGKGVGYWQAQNTPIITGCIKIEYQDPSGAFHDYTKQILAKGFLGRNINPTNPAGTVPYPDQVPLTLATKVNAQGPTTRATTTLCITDPSPNAIIRLARVRDNPSGAASPYCGATNDTLATDYWPMVLFDSRESGFRPITSSPGTFPNSPAKEALPQITALGVMNYVELDAANLSAWLKSPPAGVSLNNNTGFTVYFSDRRGEQIDTQVAPAIRTGSFGFNDITNGTSDAANGCPDLALSSGEDLEGDGILRNYGATYPVSPALIYPNALTNALPSSTTALTTTGTTYPVLQNPLSTCNKYKYLWPGATYVHTQEARENPPLFFRRALKIVNGITLNLGTTCYGTGAGNPPCGLTVAAENPVYIQGDYNAPGGSLTGAGTVAAAVAGDAVTLLSDNWNDVNSFTDPYDYGARTAVQTAYRVALIAGKGIPFPQPSGQPEDFGTDGGVHNFLRYLETWSGINCYYEGSMVSFFYNRQAIGTYKTGNSVYSPPNRLYSFDTNFTLGPSYLPPKTPVLRSVNTIGFSQEILPTQ
ncbi:MAG: pilus assembly PilX N-terminal domain-containing protein [Candidatus Acidiferrales bacterium]